MARKRSTLDVDAVLNRATRGGSVVRGIQQGGVEVLTVATATVAANPLNPAERSVPDEGLAESVSTMGVLSPLLVARVEDWEAANGTLEGLPDGVEWVVLDGHRRHAAATLAGVAEVPIIERAELADQAVELMLAANSNRLSLSPYEEALGFQRLLEKGLTQVQIAKIQGIAQGQVAKRLKLLSLPAGIARHVTRRGGDFGVSEALKLLDDESAEFLEKLAEVFVAPDGTWQTAAQAQLRDFRYSLAKQESEEKTREAAEKYGVKIIDPDEEFKRQAWRHRLYLPTEIERAADLGHLVVAQGYHGPDYYTTELTTPEGEAFDPVADPRRAKAQREKFMLDHAADLVEAGTTEALIRRALTPARNTIDTCVKFAAKLAENAGLIPSAEAWGQSTLPAGVTLATAKKLEALLSLAETNLWNGSASELSDNGLKLYRQLIDLGYEPTPWEQRRINSKEKQEATK